MDEKINAMVKMAAASQPEKWDLCKPVGTVQYIINMQYCTTISYNSNLEIFVNSSKRIIHIRVVKIN